MNSEDLIALGARLKCGEYSGADVMQAWLAIDELIDCKAALTQQEAEPDMIYHGRCIFDCGDGGHHDTELLKIIPKGTKLYTYPPKPAALPQPHKVECISAGVWESTYQCECGKRFAVNTENSTGAEQCPNSQPVASEPQDAEQFANDVAEWSQTQFEDVIRVSHFLEFMRQRDAGHARVPVEPTEAMTLAAISAVSNRKIPFISDSKKVSAIWNAMITASKQEGV